MMPWWRDTLAPWLMLIGLCLLIFWQSSGPRPPQTSTFSGIDKLAHAAAYALLAFLAARAFATLPVPGQRPALLWAAALFAALYGLSDEFHQSFVPGRSADVWDWVADLSGAIGGALIYRWQVARRPTDKPLSSVDNCRRIL